MTPNPGLTYSSFVYLPQKVLALY